VRKSQYGKEGNEGNAVQGDFTSVSGLLQSAIESERGKALRTERQFSVGAAASTGYDLVVGSK
jgi:hypothetical protein